MSDFVLIFGSFVAIFLVLAAWWVIHEERKRP